MNEWHFFSMQVAMRFGQGARPREPHDSRCACAGTKARHCSKTAGHLKLATTPEERSNLTTLNHLATISKATPSQHYRYLTSHHHSPTIKHIPHHVDCTSSHLCERLPPKLLLQTKSCELHQELFSPTSTLYKPSPCPMRRP